MHYEAIGPRVYDLIEIQTSHNRLSAYVMQHVVGRTPTVPEYRAFMNRLDQLSQHQLLPPPGWKGVGGRKRLDFRAPDCNHNLLIDEQKGDALYVDFQGFVIKDVRQYIREIVEEISQHPQCQAALGICRENDPYQSILNGGRQLSEPRWALFRQTLEKQGACINETVVLDAGCGLGMTIYAALTDGAAWAVGWDKPAVAAAARKLMFALGMTRFDIVGQDNLADVDLLALLPQNAKSAENMVLFFNAMSNPAELFRTIRDMPFKYVVYTGHADEAVVDIDNNLKGRNLHIVDSGSYRGQGSRECPVVIFRTS
jgi:hypothetical protein